MALVAMQRVPSMKNTFLAALLGLGACMVLPAHATVGETVDSAASAASHGVVRAAKAVKKGVEHAASGVHHAAVKTAEAVEHGAKKTGAAVERGARKVGLASSVPASAPVKSR
jgi:hypothetical protein